MKLREYLNKLNPSEEIGLCNSNDFHYERDSKIYNSFFIGKVADAPEEALDREVIKGFEAFMWHNQTFILEVEED